MKTGFGYSWWGVSSQIAVALIPVGSTVSLNFYPKQAGVPELIQRDLTLDWGKNEPMHCGGVYKVDVNFDEDPSGTTMKIPVGLTMEMDEMWMAKSGTEIADEKWKGVGSGTTVGGFVVLESVFVVLILESVC